MAQNIQSVDIHVESFLVLQLEDHTDRLSFLVFLLRLVLMQTLFVVSELLCLTVFLSAGHPALSSGPLGCHL